MNKKVYIVILSILLMVLVSVKNSLGFFDFSSSIISDKVNIGDWDYAAVNPNNLIDYLNSVDILVPNPTNEDDPIDIKNYVVSILFENNTVDSEGNLVSGNLNPLYSDYSLEEVIETIELIESFTDHFLQMNSSGNPVFLEHTNVEHVNIETSTILAPGEHMFIRQVVQTANYSTNQDWTPITLSITIEAPNGEDISDYAVEVLVDDTPFANSNPFSYDYLMYDRNAYSKNVADKKTIDVILKKLSDTTSFITKIYKLVGTSYTPINFRHIYSLPTTTGSWNRLPYGPNVYIGPKTDIDGSPIGEQQLFIQDNPNTREGLILLGKPNGLKSEMRVGFYNRKPLGTISVTSIPILLVISRAEQIGTNGQPVVLQTTSMVQPIVKMKVIGEYIWTE